MKIYSSAFRQSRAFTLVELLTVIAIIAILAAMLLPVLSRVKIATQKKKALMEAQAVATAIEGYDSAYGRFPVSSGVQALANSSAALMTSNDFTYGGSVFDSNLPPATYSNYFTNNAEVISILMDNAQTLVNTNHIKNPQQTKFLTAAMSGYDPATAGQPLPGVDVTGTYRDPWGNPYIITMDLNYDEQCNDAFYELKTVSQNGSGANGYYGLNNPNLAAAPDDFQFHGKVMVWSAGPDGKIDPTKAANADVNKDNVLSW